MINHQQNILENIYRATGGDINTSTSTNNILPLEHFTSTTSTNIFSSTPSRITIEKESLSSSLPSYSSFLPQGDLPIDKKKYFYDT